ncbi:hypothetical protein BGZ65_009841 [Modicella reniformis]|uniref:JmjC domain-containing protein n=1 Tax=Modicella reniformis TaxID=1440133 RepID=A0A9P6MMH4_9FUNG|nr:hypothetical protein BGZ65_009841 [Modicella reniformis]
MQAAFDPEGLSQSSIDLQPINYNRIISLGFPFIPTKRVDINQEGVDLWNEVETTCVKDGTPVILEGYHKHPKWDHKLFTFPYIEAKHGDSGEDLRAAEDVKMTMKNYVHRVHASSLDGATTEQRPARIKNTRSHSQQLLYAKDVTCPHEWRTFLMDGILPPFLGYMGSNDLNSLNRKLAAENLMIYIGQEGTWTPAHVDQCGAIGHNIMAWADDDSSSIWFMIRAEDKAKAEALWRSCGHPLEYESYFANIKELEQATFPIYVVEQKIGDLVMVPSLSYHQVVNLGKATVKVSWNRLTAHCLLAAVHEVLPRIARPEGYRIKTIIKSAVEAWKDLLQSEPVVLPLPKEEFCKSYKTILDLFQTIVEEDWVDMEIMKFEGPMFMKPRRLVGEAMPAVCDFCNTDLWNRHFRCLECKHDGDEYDVCTRCFSLGRGCKHRASSMEFVEGFSMKSCQHLYTTAIQVWNQSRLLDDCAEYHLLPDPWADEIIPTPVKDFSFATLAYKRQELLKVPAFLCHVCQSCSKNIARIDCPKCIDQYCEACLYKYFVIHWTDVASKRAEWECPACKGTCHCAQCDKRVNINHIPMLIPNRAPILMFSRPEEDARNRGGVTDEINQSFDSSDEEAEKENEKDEQENGNRQNQVDEDDLWMEYRRSRPQNRNVRKRPKAPVVPQSSRGSRGRKRCLVQREGDDQISKHTQADQGCSLQQTTVTEASSAEQQPREVKRRKQSAADVSGSPTSPPQARVLGSPSTTPTSLSSLSESSIASMSFSSPPAPPSLSVQPLASLSTNTTTVDRFSSMMGHQEEQALRFAYEHGLWRTIKTFHEEQDMSEQLRQIFEMDAFWAQRSPATRVSFQEDIMEKFAPLFKPQHEQQ